MTDERGESVRSLTHAERSIWLGQKRFAEAPLYNMAFRFLFRGDVRKDRFEEAWRRTVQEHPALRSRFLEREGTVVREVRSLEGLEARAGSEGLLVTHVLRSGAESSALAEEQECLALDAWCERRVQRRFALDGQLFDSVWIELGSGRSAWLLNQHHLVTDAASTGIVYRSLARHYAALGAAGDGSPAPLEGGPDGTPRPVAPRPFTPRTERVSAAVAHWEDRAGWQGAAPAFYGETGGAQGTANERITLALDEERARNLETLCGLDELVSISRGLSRFACFAALFAAWMRTLGGEERLRFDAPVGGRMDAVAKATAGAFIEMFPFALEVEPEDSFRSLAAKSLHEAARYVRHALPGTGSSTGARVSGVVLNYVPEVFGPFDGVATEVAWIHPGHADGMHALRLQVHDVGGTGRETLHFDWNRSALPARLRSRSAEHFGALLDAVAADPDRALASIDVRSESERASFARLQGADGSSPRPDRHDRRDRHDGSDGPAWNVIQRFEAQAQATPQALALRCGDERLDYATLLDRVVRGARRLRELGVVPGDRVVLWGERSNATVVMVLAALRARAAYVPIDAGSPQARALQVVADSGARLVLVDARTQPHVGDLQERMRVRGGRVATFDELAGPEVAEQQHPTSSEAMDPVLGDDLAYLLYTSGSTGVPKGVLVEHAALADYLDWAAARYVGDARRTFALFTSLGFDLTVTSLFLPLITGGSLVVYPEPSTAVDGALLDVLKENVVDVLKLTPAHLSLARRIGLAGSRLTCLIVGGDDLKLGLARAVDDQLGGRAEIHNEYGPTEAIVGCVAHRFDPDRDQGPSVPIGRAADRVRVAVRSSSGTPVPEGVPGELWVSRPRLARGYHGLEEETARRFVVERDGVSGTERRWYRTGDRVRQIGPDALVYLGRLDRQRKVNGMRVELGELEAALGSIPGVEQAVVVTRERRFPKASTPPSAETLSCERCGLPTDVPRAELDGAGVCTTCRTYEAIREHAQAYFRGEDELRQVFEEARARRAAGGGERAYDCMLLLSGGKDSTYALCRLVDMGLSVYAFTLDNGYISDEAKENIRSVTAQLGVPVEFATTPAMNAIFRDSLLRFANVCQGCFKTIYTLGTTRAKELGIDLIVTGLSRGQMFETRLTEEVFRDGRIRPEEVDAAVLAARKVYHRTDDEVARSLDVSVFEDDRIFDEVRYVDFYRYVDVDLDELYRYLRERVSWSRPRDTGRSTNCLINDVGIYVHKRERGFHNYALPYSWDVRLGHKTLEQARDELDDDIDAAYVRKVLSEIGYDDAHLGSEDAQVVLAAYYVAGDGVENDTVRAALAELLPAALVPGYLQRLEALPLSAHGKVDLDALPWPEHGRSEAPFRKPEGPIEEYLAALWGAELGLSSVGSEDDFFSLGGTSIVVMDVMARLCAEFDVDLPLETLFEAPTIRGLARLVEERLLADVDELSDEERARLLEEG